MAWTNGVRNMAQYCDYLNLYNFSCNQNRQSLSYDMVDSIYTIVYLRRLCSVLHVDCVYQTVPKWRSAVSRYANIMELLRSDVSFHVQVPFVSKASRGRRLRLCCHSHSHFYTAGNVSRQSVPSGMNSYEKHGPVWFVKFRIRSDHR